MLLMAILFLVEISAAIDRLIIKVDRLIKSKFALAKLLSIKTLHTWLFVKAEFQPVN
jgi:hypothetical protein